MNKGQENIGTYLKGMMWTSGGNFAAMGASLITVMFSVRILSKEDMGAYFLVMLIVQISASLGDLGLRNTAIKFLSNISFQDRNRLTNFFWTLSLVSSIGATAILAALLPWLTKLWHSNEFLPVAWTCIPLLFLTINYQAANSLLIGHKMFRNLSLVVAVSEALHMALALVFLLLGLGLISLLLSIVIARIAGTIILLFMLPQRIRPVVRHESGKTILKFSGWLQGSTVVSIITNKIADGILAAYLGTATLASYTAAMQIPGTLQRIFESIRPVILSYTCSLKMDTLDSTVLSTRILASILALGSALLIVIAHPLVLLVFSRKYTESIPIMQALSTWFAIGIVNYYLSLTLIGMGHSKKVFMFTIPLLIITVLSLFWLVPRLQAMGAAFSLILSSIVGNIIMCWMVSDGNRRMFAKLNLSALRSSAPLLGLLAATLSLKPDFPVMVLFFITTVFLFFLFRAITIKDFSIFIGKLGSHKVLS